MNQIFFPHRRIRWSDEYIHGWTFCIPILTTQVGLVRHMVGVITCYLTMKLIFIWFLSSIWSSKPRCSVRGREGGREDDTSVQKSNVDCTVQWCKVGRVTLSCTVQPGCQDCARPPPTNLPSTTIYYYVQPLPCDWFPLSYYSVMLAAPLLSNLSSFHYEKHEPDPL